jgi:hypothetical protein
MIHPFLPSKTMNLAQRHVALLQIHHKEFELKPLPLRTVRPFMLGDVVLAEAAEEEGFDVSDQIAVGKFLRARASAVLCCLAFGLALTDSLHDLGERPHRSSEPVMG